MQPTYFKSEYKNGQCTTTVVSCIDETKEVSYQLDLGPKGELVEANIQVNHLQNSIGISQERYVEQHFEIMANPERCEKSGNMVQVDYETFDYLRGQTIVYLSLCTL